MDFEGIKHSGGSRTMGVGGLTHLPSHVLEENIPLRSLHAWRGGGGGGNEQAALVPRACWETCHEDLR